MGVLSIGSHPDDRSSSLRRADSCFMAESEQKWYALQATESKRRALLHRTGDSFFNILLSYEGTFWRILTRDVLLWATVAVYVVSRLLTHFAGTDLEISSNLIGALGAVMTFFLVFFHAQYSNRFHTFFQDSVGVQGRIFDVTTIVKASLPFEQGIRIVRYLNSANVLGYVGLSGVYTFNEFFVPMNKRYRILTDEECRRIQQITSDGMKSDPVREVLTWCIRDVQDALHQGWIDPHTAQDLRGQILRVRATIGDMYDHYEQPILFIYVHFIVILTAIYLPLAAVHISHQVAMTENSHWFNDVIGVLALLLQCIFVIGIRYVAQVMRRPYAGELESLPVLSYVEDSCDMSLRIMYSSGYRTPSSTIEQSLVQERGELGDFWDSSMVLTASESDVSDEALKSTKNGANSETTASENADMEVGLGSHCLKVE